MSNPKPVISSKDLWGQLGDWWNKETVPSASGITYNAAKNPTELGAGLLLGLGKGITDGFAYPVTFTEIGLGKLGSSLPNKVPIPYVTKDITFGGSKFLKDASPTLSREGQKQQTSYEEQFRQWGTGLAKSLHAKDVNDAASQDALRLGLTVGSFINLPSTVRKNIPAIAKLMGGAESGFKAEQFIRPTGVAGTALDVLEHGALGLTSKGILETQKRVVEPILNKVAESKILDPAFKLGGKINKAVSDAVDSNPVTAWVSNTANPRDVDDLILRENPQAYSRISQALKTPIASIKHVGEELNNKGVSLTDAQAWFSSLTKPTKDKTFREIFVQSKVSEDPTTLNNFLDFAFQGDQKRVNLAKKFADSGDYRKVADLITKDNGKTDLQKQYIKSNQELANLRQGFLDSRKQPVDDLRKSLTDLKNQAKGRNFTPDEQTLFDKLTTDYDTALNDLKKFKSSGKDVRKTLTKDELLELTEKEKEVENLKNSYTNYKPPKNADSFESKFNEWKQTLSDEDNIPFLQVDDKERALLERGLNSGVLTAKSRPDFASKKVYLTNKLKESEDTLNQATAQRSEFEKSLTTKKDTFRSDLDDVKKELTAYKNQTVEARKALKSDLQNAQRELDNFQNFIQTDKSELNVLKEERKAAKKQLLQYKNSLKSKKPEMELEVDPSAKQLQLVQKDYIDPKDTLTELQQNLNSIEERIKNYTKQPTQAESDKLLALQSKVVEKEKLFDEFDASAKLTGDELLNKKNSLGEAYKSYKSNEFLDDKTTLQDLKRTEYNIEGSKDTYLKELQNIENQTYDKGLEDYNKALMTEDVAAIKQTESQFLNRANNEIYSYNREYEKALFNGDNDGIIKVEQNLEKFKNKVLEDISNLPVDESEKIAVYNKFVENYVPTFASSMSRFAMLGKFEPALGDMVQFNRNYTAALSNKLNQQGVPFDEFLNNSNRAYEIGQKHSIYWDKMYIAPNTMVSDAFGVGEVFDFQNAQTIGKGLNSKSQNVKIQTAVNPKEFANQSKTILQVMTNKPKQAFNALAKAGDAVGLYSAQESVRKSNLSRIKYDAINIALAKYPKLNPDSLEFQKKALAIANTIAESSGVKGFKSVYTVKDVKRYEVKKNIEDAINDFAGKELGRGGKDIFNQMLGWVKGNVRSNLQSFNGASDAFYQIGKTGEVAQPQRAAILRYFSDVLTNAAIFGVRGAARFPLGQIELGGDSFAQASKQTMPMMAANWLLNKLNWTDDTRRAILEGALAGRKSEEDGGGGFGVSMDRQLSTPLIGASGQGVEVFQSLGGGYLKAVGNVASRLYNRDFSSLADDFIKTIAPGDVQGIANAMRGKGIKDVQGNDITANFGEGSDVQYAMTAGLKDKASDASITSDDNKLIKNKKERIFNQFSNLEPKMSLEEQKAQARKFMKYAQLQGFDTKNPETYKVLEKMYDKIVETQRMPKFVSKKYKNLVYNASVLRVLDNKDPAKQTYLATISDDELGDIVGMIIATKKDKVFDFLIESGKIPQDKKQALAIVRKGKEFYKRHQKEITPEMESFFQEQKQKEDAQDNPVPEVSEAIQENTNPSSNTEQPFQDFEDAQPAPPQPDVQYVNDVED